MVSMFFKIVWCKFNYSRDLYCCVFNGLYSGVIKWIGIKLVWWINGCEFKVLWWIIVG